MSNWLCTYIDAHLPVIDDYNFSLRIHINDKSYYLSNGVLYVYQISNAMRSIVQASDPAKFRCVK